MKFSLRGTAGLDGEIVRLHGRGQGLAGGQREWSEGRREAIPRPAVAGYWEILEGLAWRKPA
ncbi:MAG: hypothetical protein RRB22_08630 [Gammaproteobacteria bacterium]|nr:hypothetical protein [Gammaproteobacteria bacterium]